MSSVAFVLLCVTITNVVQSVPIEPIQNDALSPKKSTVESTKPIQASVIKPGHTNTDSTDASTMIKEVRNVKEKRNIDSSEDTDEFIDGKSNEKNMNTLEHILYTKMKEQPVEINKNIDLDIDDSRVYSDVIMNSDEYLNVARKRRDINSKALLKQRNKRALSLYDLYNNEPVMTKLYESYIDPELYRRSNPAYIPSYIYSPLYERNDRSNIDSYYYQPRKWNTVSADTIENNGNEIPFGLIYDDDSDFDSDYIQLPTLAEPYNVPYDNLQLQQAYNVDGDSIYDENEEPFYTSFDTPTEVYFKY